MESDHRGCLSDVEFAEYFSEEFVEDEERMERNSNPNRKHTVKNLLRNVMCC